MRKRCCTIKKIGKTWVIYAKSYEEYFETGDKTNKILTQESIRLLCKFLFLDKFSIRISYKGLIHEIELIRNILNAYICYKIEDLSIQNRTWHQVFLERHAYLKKNIDKLVNEFVTVISHGHKRTHIIGKPVI